MFSVRAYGLLEGVELLEIARVALDEHEFAIAQVLQLAHQQVESQVLRAFWRPNFNCSEAIALALFKWNTNRSMTLGTERESRLECSAGAKNEPQMERKGCVSKR